MEYRLEIYALGGHSENDCIKVFTSSAPFAPLQAGDLLDTSSWGHIGGRLRRIVSVEHAIVEKPARGIDPSGKIINRTLIHTEGAQESARHEVARLHA
jgi:hypothetical protein